MGGALIVGSRSQVPKQILELCTRERFVFVSLDYRLAPEVKLPEIAADVQDAFRWLHEQGPKLFGAEHGLRDGIRIELGQYGHSKDLRDRAFAWGSVATWFA